MPPRRDRRREGDEPDEKPIVRLSEDEEGVWIGFYQALVSGASAGSGEVLDMTELAYVADEMLEEFRDRRTRRE